MFYALLCFLVAAISVFLVFTASMKMELSEGLHLPCCFW
jgi:hypothetical protein